LKYYDTFSDAFADLKNELVPIDNISANAVEQLYSQYFTTNDIKKFGVIAIGVMPI